MLHASLLAVLALTGASPRQVPDEDRARVVAVARAHVGQRFGHDCSAFVERVFRIARVPLPKKRIPGASESEMLFRGLARVRQPRPGDLVFFHRTYDRERPGPGRNLFTHVGVVESVKGSRVTFIHRIGTGVVRSTMNVSRPRDPEANDVLRRRRATDHPGVRHLAGELFAGYATAGARDPAPGQGVQLRSRAPSISRRAAKPSEVSALPARAPRASARGSPSRPRGSRRASHARAVARPESA